MDRAMGMVIFITLFSLIYGGMNYYPLARLTTFLGIRKGWWFYAGVALLTLSFIGAGALATRSSGSATRAVYIVSATWMGAVLILFFAVAILDLLRRFVTIDPRIGAIAVIGVTVALTLFSVVNARTVSVKTVEVGIEGLEAPVTIVQLSDIHVGAVNHRGYLEKVVTMTNALKPDLVLITGDLIDSSGPIKQEDYGPLDSLEAPAYFTLGNHEVYEGVDKSISALAGTKVKVLRNEMTETHGLQLIGIDDPAQPGTDVPAILSGLGIDKEKPAVLMFHQPKYAEAIAAQGIDLHLAGHTHNGQVFPFTLAVKLFYKHINGLYTEGDLRIHTSPGTGTWGPPMRLGSRNEITNIKLVGR